MRWRGSQALNAATSSQRSQENGDDGEGLSSIANSGTEGETLGDGTHREHRRASPYNPPVFLSTTILKHFNSYLYMVP